MENWNLRAIQKLLLHISHRQTDVQTFENVVTKMRIWECPFKIAKYSAKINLWRMSWQSQQQKKSCFQPQPRSRTCRNHNKPSFQHSDIDPENDANRGRKTGTHPAFLSLFIIANGNYSFHFNLGKISAHHRGVLRQSRELSLSLSRKCQPRPPFLRLTHVISQEKKDGWLREKKKKDSQSKHAWLMCVVCCIAGHGNGNVQKWPQAARAVPRLGPATTSGDRFWKFLFVVFFYIFSLKNSIENTNRIHEDKNDATVWATKATRKKKWYNLY